MRSVRFYGKEDVRLDEVTVPSPGNGQVRLKPAYVGICGTGMLQRIQKMNNKDLQLSHADVHEYTRGPTLIPTGAHPLTAQTLPVTLGHETSGIIDAIGPDVEGHSVGDCVAIQPILSDGDCDACEQGKPNCCLNQGFYGLSSSMIVRFQHTSY